MTPPDAYDVVILGGGLAGGSLARQLHIEAPALRTLVIEKRSSTATMREPSLRESCSCPKARSLEKHTRQAAFLTRYCSREAARR